MKISRPLWIAIALLILWFLLSWFLGTWIGLHAHPLYYLRGGLFILGIVGFVGYLLLRPKDGSGGKTVISAGELDDNFSEATKRLQASGVKQLASLHAVFILGENDSAKTTLIAKSDIAQLLSGQAQQDITIVPTRAVNFWFAKNTVFVDPAGGLLADAGHRKRLFRKFSSVGMKSVMGSNRMPARSVVFTVDCGTLLQKGGAEAIAAKARHFQAILAELAQEIGSSFPVYVVFTKTDKIPYFRDFVENLSDQEVADVLGVTLPIESTQGVYAEQQNRRVGEAFQQLYNSLAERRTTYLAREHKAPALPNIYEFPREFGKLRLLLTTFLVDLCRPSQLGISPYLRGFYFTGIRPVTVRDVSPADVQVAQDESAFDQGATRMFTLKDRGLPLAPETRDPAARKVAQWVYLTSLFPGVILADGSAATGGEGNVKLNVARRLVLSLASVAALAMGVWWIISFSSNRALVNGALEAAKRVPVVTYAAGQVAPLDSLEQLTNVKNTLATLNQFRDTGAPLSYGAFLYSGEDSRESVRKLYYALFRRLLLAPTQDRLVQVCTRPDDKPQDFAYTALRAYLITTENHARSTPEFLTPALLLHWKANQPTEARRDELAQENFAFYARELQKQNDYLPPTKADTSAVQNCRDYLNKFGQTDRIYQRMAADAAASGKAIVFNTDYPGSAATVVNTYRVEPQFTKPGYTAFEKLLSNPDKYFKGEEWVLGPASAENLDKGKFVASVRSKYQADFVKTWREYLAATHVRNYSGLPDAVSKLDILSGPQSPLLQALCVAGENTAVPSKEIAETMFQPVQAVTPAGCYQAQQVSAKPYMDKLVALHGALKMIDPSKPESAAQSKAAVTDAEGTVKTIALGFRGPMGDQQGPLKTVVRLLNEPIWAPTIVDNTPNTIAGMTCQSIAPMLEKYPFNPRSTQDATLDEVSRFLKKPEGLLWKLIDDPSMKPYLTQFGDKISAAPGARPARRAFIDYLNRAANLSRVLYPKEGAAPGFAFTMKNVQSSDVEHVTLSINGSRLSTSSTDSREFSWPGNQEGADLKVKFVGGSEFTAPKSPGLWGVWHFMDLSKEISSREFEWVQSMSDRVVTVGPQNHPAAIRFTVEPLGAAQVLRPRYFNLVCVSKAL